MTTIKRILAPTDFSDPSRVATEAAISLARRFRAEVELLHVCPLLAHAIAPGAVADDPEFQSRLLADMTKRVEALAAELSTPEVPVRGRCVLGIPSHDIASQATAEHCDLVVMATHGRSGLKRFMLGSIAEYTLRASQVPVLTVRP